MENKVKEITSGSDFNLLYDEFGWMADEFDLVADLKARCVFPYEESKTGKMTEQEVIFEEDSSTWRTLDMFEQIERKKAKGGK